MLGPGGRRPRARAGHRMHCSQFLSRRRQVLTTVPTVTPCFRLLAAGALVLGAASCGGEDAGSTPPPASADGLEGEITVFAAASLTEGFTEIAAAFTEAHPDASVTFSFDASSTLVQQILAGAPA